MMSVCSGGPNGTASKKQIRGLSCVYPSTYGTTAPSGSWPPSKDASESVYPIQYSPETMIIDNVVIVFIVVILSVIVLCVWAM